MFRKEPLHPVADISADNRADVAFIYGRCSIHDGREITRVLGTGNDADLVRERNLGIRNEGGQ